MEQYVLTTGPLSVAVDASTWSSYTSGVVTSCGTSINHYAQIVGIDETNNYWLVRNSWGTDWGLDGYIKLELGVNICDITYLPTYTATKSV
jgi:C1A family cysteine protease